MKPTLDQARTVYESMDKKTVRKLHAKLTELGYSIGHAAVGRWIASQFKNKGRSRFYKVAINGDGEGVPNAADTANKLVGSKLTPEEADLITKDMTELQALEVPALKAMMEKERLVYNIMLMRFSQRSADRLAMAPQASSALVKAMSEADVSISHIPTGQVPQLANGHMIDVSPNQTVDDIDAYFRKQ